MTTSPASSRIKNPQLPDDELGRKEASQFSFSTSDGGLHHQMRSIPTLILRNNDTK
jgi:hypothetical protein